MSKADECPYFGELVVSDNSYVKYSPVGWIIYNGIESLKRKIDGLKIIQFSIMPDHVHILMQFTKATSEHLGNIIGRFKFQLTKDFLKSNIPRNKEGNIFRKGFNDKIISPKRSLDAVVKYTISNPQRLADLKLHPEWFGKTTHIFINDIECQAYGNLQLLNHPLKSAIHISRSFSKKEYEDYVNRKLYETSYGGVAVGAFISESERELMKRIADNGGRFIKLIADELGNRYKPSGFMFELCRQGRLLIISPLKAQRLRGVQGISRQSCNFLNNMAENMEKQTMIGGEGKEEKERD